jgi:DNA-binding MltR family transcriptional regulator
MNNTLAKLNLDDLCNDTKRFIEDIQKEPDRSVPIVAVAFLDDVLKKLLEAVFIDNKKVVKQVLEYPGALSNFAVSADVAYCLGLISPKNYKDIDQIRKIRNKFSHSRLPVSFEEKEIAEMCEKLNWYKLLSQTRMPNCSSRDKFLLTAIMLVNTILMKALSVKKASTTKDYTIAEIVRV